MTIFVAVCCGLLRNHGGRMEENSHEIAGFRPKRRAFPSRTLVFSPFIPPFDRY